MNLINEDIFFLSTILCQQKNKDTISIKFNNEQLMVSSYEINFRSRIDFNIARTNLRKTISSLQLLKDDTLLNEFIDICYKILNINQFNTNDIDTLINIDCMVTGNLEGDTSSEQLNNAKTAIISAKQNYIFIFKKLLIDQGIDKIIGEFRHTNTHNTQHTEQTEYIEVREAEIKVRESEIKKTETNLMPFSIETNRIYQFMHYGLNNFEKMPIHQILLLDSPNVVWSGGSVYDIAYNFTETDLTKFCDIDLFIIGSDETKKSIIKQIISNIKKAYTDSNGDNVRVGYYNSIINIFIRGIPRMIQLIMFGNENAKREDVINHFDMEHLKTILYYDTNKYSYMCQSTKKCRESIGEKKVMLSDCISKNKVKQYRLLKAHKKGFDVSHLIDESILLQTEYKELMKNKQINDIYAFDHLKTNWNNDAGALFILFCINPFEVTNSTDINKINLRGDFGTYQTQYKSKTLSNLKQHTNLERATKSIKEFTINGIHFHNQLLVKANYKILDVYKYGCGHDNIYTYYIQISNKDIAKQIYDFNAKCFEYLLKQIKQSQHKSPKKNKYYLSSPIIIYDNKLFEFTKNYDYKGNEIESDIDSELDSDSDFEISNKPKSMTKKDFHKKYLNNDGIIIKKTISDTNKQLQQMSSEITNTGVFMFRDFIVKRQNFGMGISVNIY